VAARREIGPGRILGVVVPIDRVVGKPFGVRGGIRKRVSAEGPVEESAADFPFGDVGYARINTVDLDEIDLGEVLIELERRQERGDLRLRRSEAVPVACVRNGSRPEIDVDLDGTRWVSGARAPCGSPEQ